MLARDKKCSTNNKKAKPLAEKQEALLRDKIDVGFIFLTDKFVCKNPGRLATG